MRSALFICVTVLLSSLQGSPAFSEPAFSEPAVIPAAKRILDQVAQIEHDLDARVGLFVRDTGTGVLITHAPDDRFPLNSTFKLFACAALLARVEAGASQLEEQVKLDGQELVTWSPAVEQMLDAGRRRASLEELCAAMLSLSDNTAANLVLEAIGGPEGFTAFMRSIGDTVTRLDRWEPELNEGAAGDPRDTTTPRAIGESVEKLLLGDILAPASLEKLQSWLDGHRVADDLFRSALPTDWSIHDRTGAGHHGTRGIVSVIYRPTRQPIVAVMYIRDANVTLSRRNAAIAQVGHSIIDQLGPRLAPRDCCGCPQAGTVELACCSAGACSY